MAILGKIVATTGHTHVYTVPNNKKAVLLISATNTSSSNVNTTISIRQKVDYEVSSLLIDTEGSTYEIKPALVFSSGNAEAEVTAMNVKEFSLTGTETGYNIGNVLTSSNPSNKVVTDINFQITVTGVDVGTGAITDFNITNTGRLAEVIPDSDTITLTGGTGVGATLVVSSLRYGIEAVEVTNAGDDYTVTPTIKTVDPEAVEVELGNGVLIAQMVSDEIRKYDAIEYETNIPFGSVLERSAIVLGGGDSIYAKCNTADSLNVMVFGVEELA